jgi:hypothetical protein
MNRLTRATVGLAAAGITLVGASGSALADTTAASSAVGSPSAAPTNDSPSAAPTNTGHGQQSLAAIQKLAAAAIARRLAALNVASNAVTNSTAITATDKTTLLATLGNDVSGLTALGTTIAADTTAAKAKTDYQTIFTTYRVYALALPQVRFAQAGDDITTAVLPKLSDAQAKLAALLAGVDSGKNTPAVQAAMADLGTQISAIGTNTNGLSATVLAYTPAQYNANHALLAPSRQSLAIARNDAKTARGDIATVVSAIK